MRHEVHATGSNRSSAVFRTATACVELRLLGMTSDAPRLMGHVKTMARHYMCNRSCQNTLL